MDQGTTTKEMARGFKGLTDYTQCDGSSLYSLYLLISESLPYLVERKESQHEVESHITFSINGFEPRMNKHPWWQEDD
jgi:predicted component of type VI protein secretion system